MKHLKAVAFDLTGTLLRESMGQTLVEPIPGAVEAIKALHQRDLTMVVASNSQTPADYIERMLMQIAVSAYFSRIFTAYTLHSPKPYPAFFLGMLQTLNLQPSELLMVGDSYLSDVVGASNVGMPALWFWDGVLPEGTNTSAAVGVLRSMADLPTWVDRINGRMSS
ncbi:MAG: HAD family hydrolase [Anaerolineae bacterium]